MTPSSSIADREEVDQHDDQAAREHAILRDSLHAAAEELLCLCLGRPGVRLLRTEGLDDLDPGEDLDQSAGHVADLFLAAPKHCA